ncbi:NAD(P)H-binding protein [Melittangium boletus]|uniref:NAD(P)-binding domain-containing protein n=1 Tax=Melittangium boletus DSM 14713 TaxID=1294270 RepID=A0A250IBV3_9BACT|nr:NAD(P)H-binding protein [Melittangium boletus]ATB28690.1 hypothetical protein MEBOL_002139 [Melittangium boletus DSM 14713]
MKTAFVTGSTGLLGSNLVRLLASRGVRVKALVRSPEKARKLLAGVPVELIEGDLGNVESFAPAMRDTDVLFHTAAYFRDSYKGGSHAAGLMRINVEGTRALLGGGVPVRRAEGGAHQLHRRAGAPPEPPAHRRDDAA